MRMVNIQKVKVVCFLILISFQFFSCGKRENNTQKMENYNNYSKDMEKETFIDGQELCAPSGLVCADGKIYIANKENNCVLVYSIDGVLEDTIGNIGTNNGEFSKPKAIANFKDRIYVADESDGRIQEFDLNGNFINIFKIEEIDNAYTCVSDIEVDESYIYISIVGVKKSVLYVYIINKNNGDVKKLGKSCMGVLGKDTDNNIYFAQAFDYISDKGSSGYADGECYISSMTDSKMDKLFQLPDQYSPSEIIVYNNQLYVFSRALTQIDVFELDGLYIKTIFSENSSEDNSGLGYMAMDETGIIYLSDSRNNIIYKLESVQ